MGSVDTPGSASRVAIAGNYAYVADAYTGLQVIDVSNPGAPVIVGHVTTNYATDVAVNGSHAYVADYTSGLRVIDISNPASPALVGTADTPGTTNAVAVSGNYAYIGDGYATYPYPAAVRVIDVSNPANPFIAGGIDAPDAAGQIIVIGIFMYAVSQGSPGFRIYNISNPTSPVLTGTIPNFWASGMQIAGNLAYITGTGGGGLHIVDISNPVNPVRVGSLGIPGNTASIALAQIAALGATIAILIGMDPHGRGAYFLSLGFTFLGAAIFSMARTRRGHIPPAVRGSGP